MRKMYRLSGNALLLIDSAPPTGGNSCRRKRLDVNKRENIANE